MIPKWMIPSEEYNAFLRLWRNVIKTWDGKEIGYSAHCDELRWEESNNRLSETDYTLLLRRPTEKSRSRKTAI